ncbi:MAG: LamG-like jellyroll fold domain-containing protein [Planctomycetota bacterium]
MAGHYTHLSSYLCALDAKTGSTEGPGLYRRELRSVTLEGAMAASDTTLVAPQGRISPRLFDRKTGKAIKSLEGGGGSFVHVSDGGQIYHGPGNKTGWVTVSTVKARKPVSTFKGCNAIVHASQDVSLQRSDHRIRATSRKDNKKLWDASIRDVQELIVDAETVFVGARDRVVALDLETGKETWSSPVNGDAAILLVANSSLLVSTDVGSLHCFRVGTKPTPKAITKNTDGPETKSVTPPKPREIKPLAVVKIPGLVGRWAFHRGMADRAKRRGLPKPERRVVDMAGRLHGTIEGDIQLRASGGIEALEFDGVKNSVILAHDIGLAKLPETNITAEAWLRIDKEEKWGGIIGAIQDNGDFERGWLLGYNGSQFSFAVNGEGGPNRLTYLTSETQYERGVWYHVAGTYDGKTQKIYVNGKLENSSTEQKGKINYPEKAFYEIGAYHDKDEYFRLEGSLQEVRVYSRALALEEFEENFGSKREAFPEPIQVAMGPYARYLAPGVAEIHWRTEKPGPSAVTLRYGTQAQVFKTEGQSQEHRVRIDRLKRNRVYSYRLDLGDGRVSPEFELDTTFNYSPAPVPDRKTVLSRNQHRDQLIRLSKTIIEREGIDRGICLVLGVEDGSLLLELARHSKLTVIGLESDEDRVDNARKVLSRAGVYGHRVSVRLFDARAPLPFVGEFANLIVSERQVLSGDIHGSAAEVMRVLRPDGGVALFGGRSEVDQLKKWVGERKHQIVDVEGSSWLRLERGPLVGAGEWSHLYGRADNAAFGGEKLGGARTVKDLEVQWLGRPGPRAQPDRNGRKPSPLSTNGRLFVQGLQRLVALDSYNGSILWSLEIPPMQRFNIPRDSSNWCADDDFVFVAVGDSCWKIDARNGDLLDTLDVMPGDREDWTYDWSYVARSQEQLIGTAVKSGSAFVEFWGGADAGWYDARKGPVTFKVCSESLFALDRKTGKTSWTAYTRGVLLNSTITIGSGKVFYVECRSPRVKQSTSRRVGLPELWQDQFLVALDLATGNKLWEQKLETAKGIVTFYMAYGEGKLVIASSGAKKYDVYTFDAENGEPGWHRDFSWPGGKGDHGKAMSRPAIAGDRLFVRPVVFELSSGKVVSNMPGGGCGTYALTSNTAIFRSGNVTLFDAKAGKTTSWDRLRPGCWLSTIPAGGMLLSPEAGGGCSCGKWIETSLGFVPRASRMGFAPQPKPTP